MDRIDKINYYLPIMKMVICGFYRAERCDTCVGGKENGS